MIRIAICDDEQKDINITQKLLEQYFADKKLEYEISSFQSGGELLQDRKGFNVVFLDIEMPGENGIELGKSISALGKTHIIYVTNYTAYWKQAFNQVHAFAFLEKPLSIESVSEQMEELLQDNRRKNRITASFEIITVKEAEIQRIRKEFAIEDIYYFKFINRRIMLKSYTTEYFFAGKMEDMEQKFEQYGFVRCHNTYVVNMRHISRTEKNCIYLDNGECLPLSQRKASAFRKRMNYFIHTL